MTQKCDKCAHPVVKCEPERGFEYWCDNCQNYALPQNSNEIDLNKVLDELIPYFWAIQNMGHSKTIEKWSDMYKTTRDDFEIWKPNLSKWLKEREISGKR